MQKFRWWIQEGDSASVIKTLDTGSVDALITDPPAGIGFMGKEWDGHKGGRDKWIAWLAAILSECRRVMKPGAYGWVWALPRTAHWTMTACEDAGFAVRDVLVHVFGTGFPKSRSLLKPAAEHWILIKAPGELRELRIEENRIGTSKQVPASAPLAVNQIYGARPKSAAGESTEGYNANSGRWPANFALSHDDDCKPSDGTETVEAWQCVEGCPVKMLDEQSGMSTSTQGKPRKSIKPGEGYGMTHTGAEYADQGGASRFFYVAKPSTKERSAGLLEGARNAHTTVKATALMRHLISLIAAPNSLILDPFAGSGSTGVAAMQQDCRFVGVEQSAEYAEIARQRITHAAMQT